jgi:hypothetical protein
VPGQKKIAALMMIIGLMGCTSTGTAQLYPANAEAGRTGALTASYVNSGSDQGTVEVRMPDGEVLKGRYSETDSKSGTLSAEDSSRPDPQAKRHWLVIAVRA